MPTFPSRSQGGHKQNYGWQQKKTVQRDNFKQTNKQDDRNLKKQQILQQNKQLKEVRKFNEQIIKVVGLVPFQSNLQLPKVFQSIYKKFENSQFLDSQTTVYKADGQLVTFFEVESTDQAMTCDVLCFCAVDADVDQECQTLLNDIYSMRLLQIPNISLVMDKAQILSLLLNNTKQLENASLTQLKTQIVRQITHYTTTEPKMFDLVNDHHLLLLTQFIKNVTFQERPLWLRERMFLNILHERRFQQDGAMFIELYGQAHGPFNTSQNMYLTQYGDQLTLKQFQQLKWNIHTNQLEEFDVEIKETSPNIKLNSGEQNQIGEGAQEEVEQEVVDQVDESIQDFTMEDQTDLSSVTDLVPIQQDYEFKRAQFRTLEEQIEYPDELDINPESSLKTVLNKYFALKSLRNSALPVGQQENSELNSLFHLKQPTQLENFCMKIEGDFNGNSLVKIVLQISYSAGHFEQMLANIDQKLPGQQLVSLQEVFRAQNQEFFENIKLQNYSLVALFDNETKYGLAHARVPMGEEEFVFNNYTPCEIQVGFRRLLTIPTPYLQVAQYRGKMLRFVSNRAEFNISFPCPIFINKSNFPPIIIKFLGEKEVVLKAKMLQFNSQMQILERIVLTGWPHRIHKHQSTIKYMFFNQQDVKFFMNQYLQTRNGLNGRILSTVTTKGYFKAHFDGQLTSGDCVELKLYKLLEGSGNAMGSVYEIVPGVNMTGRQAFMELYSALSAMIGEMYERLKTMKIE